MRILRLTYGLIVLFLGGIVILVVMLATGILIDNVKAIPHYRNLDTEGVPAQVTVLKSYVETGADGAVIDRRLTFSFEAVNADGVRQTVTRDTSVFEDMFNRMPQGSLVNIRYHPKNPEVWEFEGDDFFDPIRRLKIAFVAIAMVIIGGGGLVLMAGK